MLRFLSRTTNLCDLLRPMICGCANPKELFDPETMTGVLGYFIINTDDNEITKEGRTRRFVECVSRTRFRVRQFVVYITAQLCGDSGLSWYLEDRFKPGIGAY